MNESSREVELKVGGRSQDERVRLAAHMPRVLTPSVTLKNKVSKKKGGKKG